MKQEIGHLIKIGEKKYKGAIEHTIVEGIEDDLGIAVFGKREDDDVVEVLGSINVKSGKGNLRNKNVISKIYNGKRKIYYS